MTMTVNRDIAIRRSGAAKPEVFTGLEFLINKRPWLGTYDRNQLLLRCTFLDDCIDEPSTVKNKNTANNPQQTYSSRKVGSESS